MQILRMVFCVTRNIQIIWYVMLAKCEGTILAIIMPYSFFVVKGIVMLKQIVVTGVSLGLLSLVPLTAQAMEGCGGDCTSCHSLSVKDANEIMKKAGVTVTSVKIAPAKGLYELLVTRDGQNGLVYLDFGKKHVMEGRIINLDRMEIVSAHQQTEMPAPKPTVVDVKTIPVSHGVVVGNPKGSKKLYVFTDPDCPFCRKAHDELKKLAKSEPDLAIYVMLFPLPMHPNAYDKSRAVIESGKTELLDVSFEGKELPKPAKDASKAAVDAIIAFGKANGITGTPTLVLPNGEIQVGMRDADTLKKLLNEKK